MRLVIALVLAVGIVACAALGLPARDAAQIATCQAVGRACKADGGSGCYAQYDECMKEAGLR